MPSFFFFFALKNTAVPLSWVEAGQSSLCGLFSAAQINNSDNTDCKNHKTCKVGFGFSTFRVGNPTWNFKLYMECSVRVRGFNQTIYWE